MGEVDGVVEARRWTFLAVCLLAACVVSTGCRLLGGGQAGPTVEVGKPVPPVEAVWLAQPDETVAVPDYWVERDRHLYLVFFGTG